MALTAGFGLLMLTAVGAVGWVLLDAGRQNTFDLLRQSAELTLDSIDAQLDQHLGAAARQAEYLAERVAEGAVEPADADRMVETQKIMIALAELWTAGSVPAFLVKFKTKKDCHQMTLDILSREKYADRYPSSFNTRTWDNWTDYNAAHAWAAGVLAGIDNGDQDMQRKIERLEQEAMFFSFLIRINRK